MSKPIFFKRLSLSVGGKILIKNFSATIFAGDRIAIIGRNGLGKSSFLKLFTKDLFPVSGSIELQEGLQVGLVPQLIDEFEFLSGGQKFNKKLTDVLSLNPDLLLLDEPTNHLDLFNKKSFLKMLNRYDGTLVIVTHDVDVLNSAINIIWEISSPEEGADISNVVIFKGNYRDFLNSKNLRHDQLSREIQTLNRKKKELHQDLMDEQVRAKKSKSYGKGKSSDGSWCAITVGSKKQQAQSTGNKKNSEILKGKQAAIDKLNSLGLPKIIKPTFSIESGQVSQKNILEISNINIGYDEMVLENISLSVGGKDRIAILGNNGSGKSTLMKYLFENSNCPVGYLDQFYKNFSGNSPLDCISKLRSDWSLETIRAHLATFLFFTNDQVDANVEWLSGGERARLSLAQICASTPRVLLLDEVTNNIDLETKEHVINVLNEYPGAIIVISHESDFLEKIKISSFYKIENKHLSLL